MTLINISVKGGPGSGNWGHRGVPGKVGGSSPRGAGLSPTIASKRAGKPYTGDVGRIDERANSMLNALVQDWHSASDSQREIVKINIVDTLADVSGQDPTEVNDALSHWARTANDNDQYALSMQRSTSEELDVPLSEWQKRKLENNVYLVSRLTPRYRTMERKLSQAMYDNTQVELKKAGYKPGDTVTLYRGIKTEKSYVKGQAINYNGNAIESWSVDYDAASAFGKSDGRMYGAVLAMDVPVENIFSTAMTGFGCITEGEFVIFGSVANVANVT